MPEQAGANFAIEKTTASIPDMSRRRLLAASVGAGLSGFAFAQSPARAAIVRTDFSKLPPYGNSTIPQGIRSRAVSNVHGLPELAYSWRKVMLPLASAGYHVIAPDQRGYGRTTGWDDSYDADPDPFRILNMTRDAIGLVYALGHRSVAMVVGHDAGAPVASWSALIRPDIFRSITIMSSPFEGAPSLPFDTAPLD